MASTAKPSRQRLLEEAGQLSLSEFDKFVSDVIALRAKRFAPSLTREESVLFRKINSGLPPEVRQRYRELIEKRRAESLTQAEYDDLVELTNRSEQKQAERLEALIELAKIRNITLPELMDKLGIKPPPVE
jgi:uncharacterized protein (DUF1778 family)